ncbi:DUF2797 domain-containing protein [Endozoicomonadaceae bacterium StTr2]
MNPEQLITLEAGQVLQGGLSKMPAQLSEQVQYRLQLGEQQIAMNPLLGERIRLQWLGDINCIHCGRESKKSFSQGYCYPCFKKLPQCDSCIMSPEKCHFHQGTCRDAAWGEKFCMTDHVVYLSNTSGLKVGITRINQIPTRWIDQGAGQAIPLFRVATRQQSGLIEDVLRQHVADKTNWRTLLKGPSVPQDLHAAGRELLSSCQAEIQALQQRFGLHAIVPVLEASETILEYPVRNWPVKVSSLSFDKTPVIEGKLEGIKGQYLIMDSGVLNIRKHTGYHVSFSLLAA